MRSPDSRGEKLHERGLSSVSRLWSSYTQKREDVGNQFLFPFYIGERRRGLINFHSLQIAVYLTLFVIVFKTVSVLPRGGGGGGVLGILSDGEDRRIFLGLKLLIPGFFWV